jgi:hypothetical protein
MVIRIASPALRDRNDSTPKIDSSWDSKKRHKYFFLNGFQPASVQPATGWEK